MININKKLVNFCLIFSYIFIADEVNSMQRTSTYDYSDQRMAELEEKLQKSSLALNQAKSNYQELLNQIKSQEELKKQIQQEIDNLKKMNANDRKRAIQFIAESVIAGKFNTDQVVDIGGEVMQKLIEYDREFMQEINSQIEQIKLQKQDEIKKYHEQKSIRQYEEQKRRQELEAQRIKEESERIKKQHEQQVRSNRNTGMAVGTGVGLAVGTGIGATALGASVATSLGMEFSGAGMVLLGPAGALLGLGIGYIIGSLI